ncbi:hypothetical protein N24_0967 [Corynebacterium suranareeae]|uniref:Uncharacterized protein n=1 Tax=Corynebacterium suranareeae TaxID=2506452 RepID=A0A160PN49_9CORY|nr:hypothetical protein [Corynebacterium suranareeae]BAU95229.1 hypothetical protein N24_0967 [Corynebacterium suranareeae]
MQYRQLSKIFHAAHHAQARELVETTYRERLNRPETVNTGVLVGGFPLFCVVDEEVEALVSELKRLDAQLSQQINGQKLHDLAGEEVVASNGAVAKLGQVRSNAEDSCLAFAKLCELGVFDWMF